LRRVLAQGLSTPVAALEGARGHLLPFAPVLLGLGIGVYFALPVEPAPHLRMGLTLVSLALGALGLFGPMVARLPVMALALVIGGVALAAWRAQAVAAPVLSGRYYGPIEGRVIGIDRSVSDAVRLTLDRVVLPGRNPARTPERVRVALHGPPPDAEPVPGTRVALTGHLAPPGGPVEPGGFDYRRLAWFERLGAVGYSRNPLIELAPPDPGWALAVTRLRMRLSAALRDRLPGEAGGFVAAILTGDRSGVGLETTEALRRSNLAHLLAISGLHMGLLVGVVYGALRGGLALVPPLALRLPIRKIAALAALAAAAFYLALSGGNVATQRAFVMAAVMLVAVLADRRALSLRSIAMAALIVLAWRPEALLSAGFQMSFAATVALVAVFALLRDAPADALANPAQPPDVRARRRPRRLSKPLRWARDLVLCSLVAGMATAPIAAAQFHRLAEFGLLANLLSVPLMGALVMPAAVLSAVLWPLGLEGAGLWLMQAGTRWILGVAHWVAGFDGAVRPVAAPPGWVLPVMALGELWLALWPGRTRLAGVGVMAVAALGWNAAPRPLVLVAEDGAQVGVLTDAGRVLSRARGAGFVARNWLAADGDGADQAGAAARPGFRPIPGGVEMDLGDGVLIHLFGRAAAEGLSAACRPGATVILAARHTGAPPGPCRLFDEGALARSGALALTGADPALPASAARVVAGQRPWTGRRPGASAVADPDPDPARASP
jgi:competence protein ComEC